MKQVISNTDLDFLDFIQSDQNLVGCEVELVSIPNREKQLLRLINKVKKDYDFILIDCPPSLGLLTLNALVASNSVLIPIQSEFLAVEGLKSLSETIKLVQENFNKDLKILGILITMHNKRLRLARKVLNLLKLNFKNKLNLRMPPFSEPKNAYLSLKEIELIFPVFRYCTQSKG